MGLRVKRPATTASIIQRLKPPIRSQVLTRSISMTTLFIEPAAGGACSLQPVQTTCVRMHKHPLSLWMTHGQIGIRRQKQNTPIPSAWLDLCERVHACQREGGMGGDGTPSKRQICSQRDGYTQAEHQPENTALGVYLCRLERNAENQHA